MSQRDATERLQRDETRIEESGRSICLNSYRVIFRRGVIVEWLNEFVWVISYLWNNIINIVVDIVTRYIRVLLYFLYCGMRLLLFSSVTHRVEHIVEHCCIRCHNPCLN